MSPFSELATAQRVSVAKPGHEVAVWANNGVVGDHRQPPSTTGGTRQKLIYYGGEEDGHRCRDAVVAPIPTGYQHLDVIVNMVEAEATLLLRDACSVILSWAVP